MNFIFSFIRAYWRHLSKIVPFVRKYCQSCSFWFFFKFRVDIKCIAYMFIWGYYCACFYCSSTSNTAEPNATSGSAWWWRIHPLHCDWWCAYWYPVERSGTWPATHRYCVTRPVAGNAAISIMLDCGAISEKGVLLHVSNSCTFLCNNYEYVSEVIGNWCTLCSFFHNSLLFFAHI